MTSTVSDAVFDTSSGHQCMCAWCQTGRAIRRLRELEPAEAARAELDTLDNALNILYEDSFAAWETMNDIATAAGLDWIGATRESILDAIRATRARVRELEEEPAP